MRKPHRRGEAGVATGVTIGVAALVLCAALAAVAGARVLVAHREAAALADLGSLAGAVAVQRGGDGCLAAREHVRRAGASAVDCRTTGERVRLVVRVEVGKVLGRQVTVAARAHAGPR